MNTVRVSKFLSLVLRHHPERAGIVLDEAGWVSVDDLLAGCARCGMVLDRRRLEEIVRDSDKQRFALSEDGTRIRASQGHSVQVALGYVPKEPPEELFHGTVDRFLGSIREKGLVRGSRHHVHLSADRATAQKVGQRRGRAVVLRVRAGAMHRDGHAFYVSDNGVWLTDQVPPAYLVEE